MKTPDNGRPFIARTRFLLIALLVAIVYSYGWKVTKIDLKELVQDFHLVKPLVSELLHPDLVTTQVESKTVEAAFRLSGPLSLDPKKSPSNDIGTAQIILSMSKGAIGDSLTVEGGNLPPEIPGRLFWVNSIEQEFPLGNFSTDKNGNFSMAIEVPQSARGEEQIVRAVLTWKTGGWRASDTLKLTAEKMVETLFLALMATTMGVLLAVPLSFLGARNLMTRHLPGRRRR